MIIFMGLAGSGKSTEGQILAKRLGCPWISTGQILRNNVEDPQIIQKMLEGEVLSDEVTLPFLEEELKRVGADKNELILDGSPRTLYQAQWLDKKIKAGEIKFTAIIHLHISKAAAKIRLLARGRSDDHEMAIAERFQEYDEAIVPILEYLKSQGYSIHEVDGEHATTTVAADVERALGLHQQPAHESR